MESIEDVGIKCSAKCWRKQARPSAGCAEPDGKAGKVSIAVNGGSSGLSPLTSVISSPLEPGDGLKGVEHCAVAPPLLPPQLQLQGPLPLTAEAMPVLQKFVVGALTIATPLADPQVPLTPDPPDEMTFSQLHASI